MSQQFHDMIMKAALSSFSMGTFSLKKFRSYNSRGQKSFNEKGFDTKKITSDDFFSRMKRRVGSLKR